MSFSTAPVHPPTLVPATVLITTAPSPLVSSSASTQLQQLEHELLQAQVHLQQMRHQIVSKRDRHSVPKGNTSSSSKKKKKQSNSRKKNATNTTTQQSTTTTNGTVPNNTTTITARRATKLTHSEATLAYLDSMLTPPATPHEVSQAHHHHHDPAVISGQINRLQQQTKEWREQKEKEAPRLAEQRKQELHAYIAAEEARRARVAAAAVALSPDSDGSVSSSEIELHYPDAKKAKHGGGGTPSPPQTNNTTNTTSTNTNTSMSENGSNCTSPPHLPQVLQPTTSDFSSSAFNPDYSLDQFQFIRDDTTNTYDENPVPQASNFLYGEMDEEDGIGVNGSVNAAYGGGFLQQQQQQPMNNNAPQGYEDGTRMDADVLINTNNNDDADMTSSPTATEDTSTSVTAVATPTQPPPFQPGTTQGAQPPPSAGQPTQPPSSAAPEAPRTIDPSIHMITPSEASRAKLDSLLSDRMLIHLEESFMTGKISIDTVRYELTLIHNLLEPDHERELMEEFGKMRMENVVIMTPYAKEEEGKHQHGDVTMSSNNNNAATTASSSRISSAATSSSPPSSSTTTTTSTSHSHSTSTNPNNACCTASIIHRTLSSLPAYSDSLTPDQAIEDDPDGVARIRIHVYLTNPSEQEAAAVTPMMGGKRKQQQQEDDSSSSSSSSSSTNSSISPCPLISTFTSTSTALTTPTPSSINRMMYVNRAFERLSGFTQAQVRQFGMSGKTPLDLTLRKDHYHTVHRILQRWRRENVRESVMYQVRRALDATTREEVFMYFLVHFKIEFIQGRLHEQVVSLMPLPDDPEHPMPPFVDGVDLDEETVLYGYKLPKKD